jgi:hypothetical protein
MRNRPRAFAIGLMLLLVPSLPAAVARAQSFVAVSSPAIASHVSFATGASWVDYDGDGDLDLYVVTSFAPNDNNALFRNDGGDVFTRVTGLAVVEDSAQTVCSTWADADNDGDLDAFVSGLDTDGSFLFRGMGGGGMAAEGGSGLTGTSIKGTGCAWGDYDADGFVDLALAVYAGALGMSGPSRIFRNLGDGTFAEVAVGDVSGVSDTHHHVTWADYDGDGDLDLFFATGPVGSLAPDRMYRNLRVETGTATFQAIATGVLATDARDSQTLSFADYDNDGDLDGYAINYTTIGNQLYRNDGGGAFTKITTGAIVTTTGAAHGVAWGDYDNDGDLDVFVVRDNNQTDRYYRNNGDGTFASVTTGAFVTTARSGYSACAGDYDQDGDLDLFVPTARSEGPGVLWRNDLANGHHWIELTLVGTVSNRSAIGAKARVRAVVSGAPRTQMREIAASTGYGGQGMLAAHFGLGDATVADTVRIEWPSGHVDTWTDLAADRAWTLIEATGVVGVPRAGGAAGAAFGLRVSPNPVRGAVEVAFELPAATSSAGGDEPDASARLTVHDVTGRLVRAIDVGAQSAGWQRVTLPPGSLQSPGVYFVRLETAAGTAVERFVFVR